MNSSNRREIEPEISRHFDFSLEFVDLLRYRRKKRNQTPQQLLKRYRGLLSEKEISIPMLRKLVLQLDDQIDKEKKEFYDLDAEIREWRNSVKADGYYICDSIVELVDLQLENAFYHPNNCMEEVEMWYKEKVCTVLIPLNQPSAYRAAFEVILLQDSKLYYWTFNELVTDRAISYDLVYTKRCDPKKYATLDLSEFLKNYPLSFADLV